MPAYAFQLDGRVLIVLPIPPAGCEGRTADEAHGATRASSISRLEQFLLCSDALDAFLGCYLPLASGSGNRCLGLLLRGTRW